MTRSGSTAASSSAAKAQPAMRLSLVLALVVTLGLCVRIFASAGDFWLDEILSLNVAHGVRSPWEIFRFVDDNNHPLNTLVLHVLGDQPPMYARLPAALAGAAAIAAAAVFARRWGKGAATVAAIIFAGSFIMVHYASEARGYAMLVCFSMLAMLALERGLQRRSWRSAMAFAAACALGLLAHFLFLQMFLALAVWAMFRLLTDASRRREFTAFAAMYLLPPAIFIAILYVTFIRHVEVLGAPIASPGQIIAQAAAFALGIPRPAALPAIGVAAAVIGAGLVMLWRRGDDSWVLLGMMCIGAPLIGTLVTHQPSLLLRYVMVPIIGLYLLLAFLLSALFARGGASRIAAVVGLLTFLVGDALDARVLLRDGRGQYTQALRDILAQKPEGVIRVSGDHDFREAVVLAYYAMHLRVADRIEYVTSERVKDVAPDFVLFHSFDGRPPRGPSLRDAYGRSYALMSVYPTGPLSGWWWYVYQRT